MTEVPAGRQQQRDRTRARIVEAAARLLAGGDTDPSVGAVATEAGVSRRTVYGYFSTVDHLLLDATAGMVSASVDLTLDSIRDHPDPKVRVRRMVEAVCATMERSLPLGRRMIRLTVDDGVSAPERPKRGYRRIAWIEEALVPIRGQLTRGRYEDLVSELAVVIGWEAFIVLSDVRALPPDQATATVVRMAVCLVDNALATSPSRSHR